MSQTIDQRVVEMRFDNQQFESGVKTSLSTIEKLKAGLNFKGATKGLDELSVASKGIDFSKLNSALDIVNDRFSMLGIIGVSALQRITAAAVDTGIRLAKSLSIDQIASGWQKYADKTTAVQTIIAATHKEIDEVEEELDKLSWFTDETSYSFIDMVNSIGKFTSAGVELDEAVTAMQGISTWAAISGGNIQEAGRAMYNLSQAMGSGVVQAIDWKSIENANMATKEFKQTAIDVAVELGQLKKRADGVVETAKGTIVTAENLRSTLNEKWFNDKVLLKALDAYGGFTNELYKVVDETGDLTSEWLEAVGEYKDGTTDFAEISENTGISVQKLHKYLTPLVKDEYDLGYRALRAAQEAKTFEEAINSVKDAVSSGWMTTFQLIFGNYDQAKRLWTDLANTLYDYFAESGNARNEILQEWNELGGREDIIEAVKEAFESLMTVLRPIKEAFKDIFPSITAQQLFTITARVKNFTSKMGLSKEAADGLRLAVSNLLTPIRYLADWLKKAVFYIGAILRIIGDIVDHSLRSSSVVVTAVKGVLSKLTPVFNVIKNVLLLLAVLAVRSVVKIIQLIQAVAKLESVQRLGNRIVEIFSLLKSFGVSILQIFGKVFNTTKDAVRGFDLINDILVPMIDLGASALEVILGVVSSVLSAATEIIDGIFDIKKAVKTVSDVAVSETGTAFTKIGNFIGKFLTTLANLMKNLTPATVLLAGLVGFIIFIVRRIADLFSIVRNGIDIIGDIEWILDGVARSFQAAKWAIMAKALATALLSLGGALLMIAVAIHVISKDMASDSLNTGVAIAAMVAFLAILALITDGLRKVKTNGFAMIGIAAFMFGLATAIAAIGLAVSALAKYKWDQLLGAVLALIAVLWTIADFSQTVKSAMAAVPFLLAMSLAVVAIAAALGIIGLLPYGKIFSAVLALSAIIYVLGQVANNMVAAAGMFPAGIMVLPAFATMLLGLSVALVALGASMLLIGLLPIEKIAASAIAIGGIFAVIVYMMNQMIVMASVAPAGMAALPAFASVLLTLSVAFVGLGAAMFAIGLLPAEKILYSALAIGGIIAVLVVMINSMMKAAAAIPIGITVLPAFASVLLTLSVAFAALGAAIFAIGLIDAEKILPAAFAIGGIIVVLVAMINELVKVAAIMPVGIAVLPAFAAVLLTLSVSLVALGAAIFVIGMLPVDKIQTAALAVGGILSVIGVMVGMLVGIASVFPVGLTVLPLFSSVLLSLSVSLIALSGAMLLIGSLPVEKIQNATDAFVEVIGVLAIIVVVITTVSAVFPAGIAALASFAGVLISFGVASIGFGIGALSVAAAIKIIAELFVWLVQIMGQLDYFTPAYKLSSEIVSGLVLGLVGGVAMIIEGIAYIVKSMVDFFKDLLGIDSPSKLFAAFGDFIIQGLVAGIKAGVTKVVNAMGELANATMEKFQNVLGIHSKSRMFAEFGLEIPNGAAYGIKEGSPVVMTAVGGMGADALKEFGKYTTQFKDCGSDAIGSYVEGLTSGKVDLLAQIDSLTGDIIGKFDAVDLTQEGKETGQSFLDGLKAAFHAAGEGDKDGSIDRFLGYLSDTWIGTPEYAQMTSGERAKREYERKERERRIREKQEKEEKEEWEKIFGKGGGGSGSGSSGSGSSKTKEDIIEFTDILQVASDAVDQFEKNYSESIKKTFDETADVSLLAKVGFEQLASQLYAQKVAAMDADKRAEEMAKSAEVRLSNMYKTLKEFRDKVKEKISGQINFFSDTLNVKDEKGPKGFNKALHDNLKQITEYTQRVRQLGERGISEEAYKYITGLGFTAEGFKLAKAYALASDEEIKDLNETFGRLNGMADEVADTTMAGMVKVGMDATDGWIKGFDQNAGANSAEAFTSGLIGTMQTKLDSHSPSRVFMGFGSDTIQGFLNGVSGRVSELYSQMESVGTELMASFNAAVNFEIPTSVSNMWNAGLAAVQGFARGIRENVTIIQEAAAEAAYSAYESAMASLDANSPSKLMSKVGLYADQGLAIGLSANSALVTNASTNVGTRLYDNMYAAVQRMNAMIMGEIDPDPVITPTLDLSRISAGASQLGAMFNQHHGLSVNGANASDKETNQNGGTTFIQNNYSPKALSRIDIYRQTKNQFAYARGVVG